MTNNNDKAVKEQWLRDGFIGEAVPEGIDLAAEIRRMCREKRAVVLAHYYNPAEIQRVADFVGDSLALARQAASTDADIIVMCGVHFMAETCKLLSPAKTVLTTDLSAGCSLADSCRADDLKRFKAEHPGHMVVSYVNTTAAVKALTDVVVTSGNAEKIIRQLPADAKIIFGPDRHLGEFIAKRTGREMLLWPGGCGVHEQFEAESIAELKREHPDAEVLVHPECSSDVVALADVAGSTAVLLKHAQQSATKEFIVVTEAGILHEMERTCPDKTFLPARPRQSGATLGCRLNECRDMKLATLEKLYNTLRYEWPEVVVDPAIAADAVRPIDRMLEMS